MHVVKYTVVSTCVISFNSHNSVRIAPIIISGLW